MRSERGLEKLVGNYSGKSSIAILADFLLIDLKEVTCSIFGKTENGKTLLLSKLKLMSNSLYYEEIEKRIDFMVTGKIMNNQCVPLTYRVQGENYYFYGRCSTVARVCGVDLYLSRSYTERVGDMVWQRFSIDVKKLVKLLG